MELVINLQTPHPFSRRALYLSSTVPLSRASSTPSHQLRLFLLPLPFSCLYVPRHSEQLAAIERSRARSCRRVKLLVRGCLNNVQTAMNSATRTAKLRRILKYIQVPLFWLPDLVDGQDQRLEDYGYRIQSFP
jgi:hypothetical protein